MGKAGKRDVDEGVTSMSARAERVNWEATFLPQTEDGTRPALEVAGVLVYAYVDDEGEFVVSVHFETADTEAFPEWADEVPVRVSGVPRHAVEEAL